MAQDENSKQFASVCIVGAIVFSLVSIYWQYMPLLAAAGADLSGLAVINRYVLILRDVVSKSYAIRLICLVLILAAAMMKTGRKTDESVLKGIIIAVIGTTLVLLPSHNGWFYAPALALGLAACMKGYSIFFRQIEGGKTPEDDSFLQTDELIDTEDSINIPYHYTYKKKNHKAWINIVAPFRASLVMGVPGSGKSFAVYNKCIEDMVRKSYTFMLYDYKFPDLTEELLNEIYYQKKYEGLWKDDKVPPKLYILNFDDPKRSNRCNPIHHTYITDPADTTEIADLLFKNINKGSDSGKGFDFFNESAKVYLDALAWYLANYDPDAIYGGEDGYTVIGSSTDYVNKGCYCTFPHIIELMAYNYQKTFQILQFTHGLEAKISPFASALESQAMEQLMGQVASAQIPLGKFVSPALYWIMTGDDFTLDINNPEDPKIVCLGNNPDRQSIYGSAIALYTSRTFKLINHKHKRKCAVLLDELPTVFIKGLDNLIATARSNKVAIIIGAQDRTQLKRDYGQNEADVIIATVGNILSGQVNTETAKFLSEMFGKEFREQRSKSISDSSDSTSISFQLQEILPASKIGTLSQGVFVGRVADNFGTPIERKLWCGSIDVDMERAKKKKEQWQKVPVMTDFFEGVMPEVPEEDLIRLKKMYPKLKDKPKKLRDKYVEEKVDEAVMRNFEKVKKDIQDLVEKEFKRTLPFAQQRAAEAAANQNNQQ